MYFANNICNQFILKEHFQKWKRYEDVLEWKLLIRAKLHHEFTMQRHYFKVWCLSILEKEVKIMELHSNTFHNKRLKHKSFTSQKN